MASGYCVKCKAKRDIKDAKQVTMKNGRAATQGTCPVCGTKIFKIGGGAEQPAASASASAPGSGSASGSAGASGPAGASGSEAADVAKAERTTEQAGEAAR